MASPWCGFVGLSPLPSIWPLSPSVPLTWSNVMPEDGAAGASCAKRGSSGERSTGPAESLHAAASAASANVPETAFDVCMAICLLEEYHMRSGARLSRRANGQSLGRYGHVVDVASIG